MSEFTTSTYAFQKGDTAKKPKGKVTATTASAELAASNPARVELIVCNNGEKPVWLSYGATAVAEEGIRLEAKTGSIIITGYTGRVDVITKETESVVSFAEC